MAISSSLSFEWYVPQRIYIIHIVGVITSETLATMSQKVIDMLNAPNQTQPVHLIYNAEMVHLKSDMSMANIQDWTALVYRHPLTASIVTVTGRNRLHKYIAASMNTIFTASKHWGQTTQTLNEALRMVCALDSTLPPMNI
jgi:hypothetical protein